MSEHSMRFAPLVGRVAGKGANAWRVHFDAVRQRGAGRDVILLTVGDPDQAPPQAMIDATIEALRRRHTGYSPIIGLPELRAAIAASMARRSGQPCAAENIVVVPGTQAGLYCTMQCIVGVGDKVIVP
jgi:arginine:pyruvate transaminase